MSRGVASRAALCGGAAVAAGLAFAAASAQQAGFDAAAIAREQVASLRGNICPAPGTPAMGIAELSDTAPAHVGLDPADIRYVIVSHAHNDHFGGAKHLQDAFGARIVMAVEDWEHMRSWPQLGSLAAFPRDDIAVRDGYTITLGDTTVRIVATPGHTPGTISPIFPVRDGGEVHYVGYWGASAVSFLPPEGIVEYMASADRFARIDARVDVPLTNHPFIDGSLLKLEALAQRRRGDPHPFVEGNAGFRSWMAAIHDCAGEVLEQKLQAAR